MELPRADPISGIIKRRDGQRIDDEGQQGRDRDVGARGNRQKRRDERVQYRNDDRDEQPQGDGARDGPAVQAPQ